MIRSKKKNVVNLIKNYPQFHQTVRTIKTYKNYPDMLWEGLVSSTWIFHTCASHGRTSKISTASMLCFGLDLPRVLPCAIATCHTAVGPIAPLGVYTSAETNCAGNLVKKIKINMTSSTDVTVESPSSIESDAFSVFYWSIPQFPRVPTSNLPNLPN